MRTVRRTHGEEALEEAAQERERKLIQSLRDEQPLPAASRRLYELAGLEPDSRGFVPVRECARMLDVTVDEVYERIRSGEFETDVRPGALFVQPAVVTTTRVRKE
jgi:hypothetical protein